MVTTSSDSFLVPFGAAAPFFGTNPTAMGFPTGKAPMILDMARTTVPFGKIALAKAEGEKIPAEWGLDRNGYPTTDPDAVVGLHPVAGPKGSGIASIIDVFSNLFVGLDKFKSEIDKLISELHALPVAEGFSRIYYPGELEAERATVREAEGIPIDSGLEAKLRELSEQLSVDFPGSC